MQGLLIHAQRDLKSNWYPTGFYGLLLAVWMAGCTVNTAVNPSFDLTRSEAEAELRQMAAHPASLERPVVVLAGWADPFLVEWEWRRRLDRVLDDPRHLSTSFGWMLDMERCRRHVVDQVQLRWPSEDPGWTVEVDVVGFSMGGLVARYATLPPRQPASVSQRRLNIKRLFTISTPHRGARMAWVPSLEPRVRDMKAGSGFLAYLGGEKPTYELFTYTRLGDGIVGADNTSPVGTSPWWVSNPLFALPHLGARQDPRIVADILRRLRNEPAYARRPASPLP